MSQIIVGLTQVSGVLVLDDPRSGEPIQLTAYLLDGHVVIALVDEGEPHEPAELDDLIVLTPDCAETLGRDLVRRAIEARSGTTSAMEEA
jgi:hypothetical protein